MSFDENRQSPFPPGYAPELTTPWIDEPEPPRLSILHFIVGAACVAIYLGLNQTVRNALLDTSLTDDSVVAILWGLDGVSAGLALGGLLLWLIRRIGGITFPRHPGEYLLVMLGMSMILWGATRACGWYLDGSPYSSVGWQLVVFVSHLGGMVLNLWAARRIGIVAWRNYFLLAVGLHLLQVLINCVIYWPLSYVVFSNGPHLVIVAFLVLRDHLRGIRCPWTHWLGVGLVVWNLSVQIGHAVYSMLSKPV